MKKTTKQNGSKTAKAESSMNENEIISRAIAKVRTGQYLTEEESAAFKAWESYDYYSKRMADIRYKMDQRHDLLTLDDFRWYIRWGGISADMAVKHPACPESLIARALSSKNKWVRGAAVETAFRRGIRFAVA